MFRLYLSFQFNKEACDLLLQCVHPFCGHRDQLPALVNYFTARLNVLFSSFTADMSVDRRLGFEFHDLRKIFIEKRPSHMFQELLLDLRSLYLHRLLLQPLHKENSCIFWFSGPPAWAHRPNNHPTAVHSAATASIEETDASFRDNSLLSLQARTPSLQSRR